MPQFERYLGIDYSGAQTPDCSLKGLRVYMATHFETPTEVLPPPSPRKYWTRRGLAKWLSETLREGPPTLVGIDHAFSFPLRYFEVHRIAPDWPTFLEDFHQHWPTDEENMYVDFIRDGSTGNGAARTGLARWRRLTELRCRAKSVFHFDVQGTVAKSTHAGLPWLLHLRRELGPRLHFWPFEGWTPPADRSVIAEVYPSLWSKTFPIEDRTPDQHDAYSAARWMQETDAAGKLSAYFHPPLSPPEQWEASVEGWILGIA
jgi:hypothetical protein